MIEWLTGESHCATRGLVRAEDGVTLLDEAPETPAPLFAIRAFKTAIFGTPHTATSERPRSDEHQDARQGSQRENNVDLDIGGQRDQQSGSESCSNTKAPSLGAYLSPAKGILLTPGTATSKRKTVSFRGPKEHAIFDRKITPSEDDLASPVPKSKGREQPGSSLQGPRHSKLTKTLMEMSTKRVKSQSDEIPQETAQTNGCNDASTVAPVAMQHQHLDISLDQTIDLSKPRSRSGQHWKSEYEEYYKRSNREMKKVIQYGQNIKSYALKKDHEASILSEDLKKELAKVKRMEARISWLAKQLSAARLQIPSDESTQNRLVGELAQQTALASQYQRKAERYRKAMKRRFLVAPTDATNEASITTDFGINEHQDEAFEAKVLKAQLERLRESAREAQNRATILETENLELKRSLARVKEEMMSYELRRKSKEQRLKAREHKVRAEKEQCETELEQVRFENLRLLRAVESRPDKEQQRPKAIEEVPLGYAHTEKASNQGVPRMFEKSGSSTSKAQQRSRSSSPRKRKQNTASRVDIWTLGSPPSDQVAEQNDQKSNDALAIGTSSVKRDIHRALGEINQNLLATDHRQPVAFKNGALHNVETPRFDMLLQDRKSEHLTADDSNVGIVTAAAAHDRSMSPSQQSKPPRTHALDPASVQSIQDFDNGGGDSRAETMGSARTSSLSAERTRAAKARLAEKKRSAEKRIREA